jgi:hypothetical protein
MTKAAQRPSDKGGTRLLEPGCAASFTSIPVRRIRRPRPSFEVRAGAGSFVLRRFAGQFKHSICNFRSNKTLKILPDCSQYVGNFLIGRRHCSKIPLEQILSVIPRTQQFVRNRS